MQISLFKYEIRVEISLCKSADIFISNFLLSLSLEYRYLYSKYRYLYFKYRFLYFKYRHRQLIFSSSVFVPIIVTNNIFTVVLFMRRTSAMSLIKRLSGKDFHWEAFVFLTEKSMWEIQVLLTDGQVFSWRSFPRCPQPFMWWVQLSINEIKSKRH